MVNHQAEFKERYSHSVAEPKSEEFYRGKGYTYFSYGVDSKDVIPKMDFIVLPELIQKTPDYILITGPLNPRAYFVEVKGCNDILRLKVKDLEIYKLWSGIGGMRFLFFVYSTHFNEHKQVLFHKMMDLIRTNKYPTDKYHDNNKEYYKIPVEDLWKI